MAGKQAGRMRVMVLLESGVPACIGLALDDTFVYFLELFLV